MLVSSTKSSSDRDYFSFLKITKILCCRKCDTFWRIVYSFYSYLSFHQLLLSENFKLFVPINHCIANEEAIYVKVMHFVVSCNHFVRSKTCNLCEDNRKEEIVENDQHENESDREIVDMEEDDEDMDNVEYSESETTTDQVEEETEEEITKEPTTILSTIIPYSTTKSIKKTVCMDSSIDCEGKRYLCSERRYAQLMSRECPKTCNLCQSGTTINGVTQNGMNIWKCHDIAYDCIQSLCNHRSYRQLMQTVCKKTCLLC
ncbi:ShK domain-like family protein [Acanthocheilonema viteae]